jgi:hypothetical protein
LSAKKTVEHSFDILSLSCGLTDFFPALLPFFLLFQRSFCSFLSSWSNQVFLFEQMSISSNEQEETIYKTDKYKFRKAKNDQKKF